MFETFDNVSVNKLKCSDNHLIDTHSHLIASYVYSCNTLDIQTYSLLVYKGSGRVDLYFSSTRGNCMEDKTETKFLTLTQVEMTADEPVDISTIEKPGNPYVDLVMELSEEERLLQEDTGFKPSYHLR